MYATGPLPGRGERQSAGEKIVRLRLPLERDIRMELDYLVRQAGRVDGGGVKEEVYWRGGAYQGWVQLRGRAAEGEFRTAEIGSDGEFVAWVRPGLTYAVTVHQLSARGAGFENVRYGVVEPKVVQVRGKKWKLTVSNRRTVRLWKPLREGAR